MGNNAFRELAANAEARYGVFTMSDVDRAGLSRSYLARGVRTGRFLAPLPGVYVIAGTPDSSTRRVSVAVNSFPSLSAVSHDTAAELWGLTDRGVRSIHVVTARWDRVVRPGVTVHESGDLLPEDVVIHRGIPITTPARTVVDLGATNPWLVERALEKGVRHGLLSLEDVEGFVDRVARRGRRGVGVIRPLLDARKKWDGTTESALEDLFLKTITELGLPQPVPQYVVRDDRGEFVSRADFAYPPARVLMELDSEAHHLDRITFRRDRAKQNSAVLLGWRVLRFTWWDLQQNPYEVGAQIRDALSASTTTR